MRIRSSERQQCLYPEDVYAHTMLFLLDLQHRAIMKAPLDHVRLFARTLDEFALGDC